MKTWAFFAMTALVGHAAATTCGPFPAGTTSPCTTGGDHPACSSIAGVAGWAPVTNGQAQPYPWDDCASAFDHGDAVIASMSSTGSNSWHFRTGFVSPGSGTHASTALSVCGGGASGRGFSYGFDFAAPTCTADGSRLAPITAPADNSDRASAYIEIFYDAGKIAVRAYEHAQDGSTWNGAYNTLASGLDLCDGNNDHVWHHMSCDMTPEPVTSPNGAYRESWTCTVDDGAPVQFYGYFTDARNNEPWAAVESCRLKFQPRHQNHQAADKGFVLDDLYWAVTSSDGTVIEEKTETFEPPAFEAGAVCRTVSCSKTVPPATSRAMRRVCGRTPGARSRSQCAVGLLLPDAGGDHVFLNATDKFSLTYDLTKLYMGGAEVPNPTDSATLLAQLQFAYPSAGITDPAYARLPYVDPEHYAIHRYDNKSTVCFLGDCNTDAAPSADTQWQLIYHTTPGDATSKYSTILSGVVGIDGTLQILPEGTAGHRYEFPVSGTSGTRYGVAIADTGYNLTMTGTPYCGDGNVDAAMGETCDDGGFGAACNPICQNAVCGDGFVDATTEDCDDGNNDDGDDCPADCMYTPAPTQSPTHPHPVCFTGDTILRTKGGHLAAVRDLAVGDELETADGRTTVLREINRSPTNQVRHVSDSLQVTDNHAVRADGKWVLGSDLPNTMVVPNKEPVYGLRTDSYCEDVLVTADGHHVEGWDGALAKEWRPHYLHNGERVRCADRGSMNFYIYLVEDWVTARFG